MAECFKCGNEMQVSNGCDSDRTIQFGDGEEVEPIPFTTDDQSAGKCHDCGAFPGEHHHPGCDMERCPRCGGQYFICDCETEEKEELWAE